MFTCNTVSNTGPPLQSVAPLIRHDGTSFNGTGRAFQQRSTIHGAHVLTWSLRCQHGFCGDDDDKDSRCDVDDATIYALWLRSLAGATEKTEQ
mmetsp:Transcript_33469/g.69686  ORF Transcript_33469/g.69686 Transcript_33469/m.69686 type:complete len:93 (-) Transcript_33469:170-448(-)